MLRRGEIRPMVAGAGRAAGIINRLPLDHTAGDPGESPVVSETQQVDEDIAESVAERVLGLLAAASERLLESVENKATGARIIDRFTELLADMK